MYAAAAILAYDVVLKNQVKSNRNIYLPSQGNKQSLSWQKSHRSDAYGTNNRIQSKWQIFFGDAIWVVSWQEGILYFFYNGVCITTQIFALYRR